MGHPDASNTHLEIYPKFQVQLGRVVLLEDMLQLFDFEQVLIDQMIPFDRDAL